MTVNNHPKARFSKANSPKVHTPGQTTGTTKLPFEEVEPWHEQVDPRSLLDQICEAMRHHIVADTEIFPAATLWTAMTYLVDIFDIAPLLVITAPEMRCGKSEFRRLLGKMVHRPVHADNMTSAVLFRCFDLWHPTLLIDEYDTFIRGNEELRGVFNAGHQRGGCIWRCVGEEFVPTPFDVFGPKVLAGIGHLPPTLMDRSIILPLRRKLPSENILSQRDVPPAFFREIKAKLARLALDFAAEIEIALPQLPAVLSDRAQDNWEPLLKIAYVAGGHWPERAMAAALKLSRTSEDGQTTGVQLLHDIQELFATRKSDRVASSDLITELCADDEKRWATYNRGFPITPTQVAKRLREYGISSKTIRTNGATLKGYTLDQFKDAFARYVFAAVPGEAQDVTPSLVKETKYSHVTATQRLVATPGTDVSGGIAQATAETTGLSCNAPEDRGNTGVTQNPRSNEACDGVTANVSEDGALPRSPNQLLALNVFAGLIVQERLNSFIDDQGQMDFETERPCTNALPLDAVVQQIAAGLWKVDRRMRAVKAQQLCRELIDRGDLILTENMLSRATEETLWESTASTEGHQDSERHSSDSDLGKTTSLATTAEHETSIAGGH